MSEFESEVLSNQIDLLKSLKGQQIKEMIHYLWDPPEQVLAETIEYDLDHPATPDEIFSYALGSLYITFESGLAVTFGSVPSLASVNICSVPPEEQDITDDEDDNPIFASDPIYSNEFWKSILGQTIAMVQIIKKKLEGMNYLSYLPYDAGLLIKLENGTHFIASHGLHDNSDSFSVIVESQIDPEIRNNLVFTQSLQVIA